MSHCDLCHISSNFSLAGPFGSRGRIMRERACVYCRQRTAKDPRVLAWPGTVAQTQLQRASTPVGASALERLHGWLFDAVLVFFEA